MHVLLLWNRLISVYFCNALRDAVLVLVQMQPVNCYSRCD